VAGNGCDIAAGLYSAANDRQRRPQRQLVDLAKDARMPRAMIVLLVLVIALVIGMVALSKRNGEQPLTRIEQPVTLDGAAR